MVKRAKPVISIYIPEGWKTLVKILEDFLDWHLKENSKSLSPTYTNLDDLLIDYAAYADSPILSCRGQILQPNFSFICKNIIAGDCIRQINRIVGHDSYNDCNCRIIRLSIV